MILVQFSEEQYAAIREVADRTGAYPLDIIRRALELGWPAPLREVDGVPPSPQRPAASPLGTRSR